jgi:hypothetical protein
LDTSTPRPSCASSRQQKQRRFWDKRKRAFAKQQEELRAKYGLSLPAEPRVHLVEPLHPPREAPRLEGTARDEAIAKPRKAIPRNGSTAYAAIPNPNPCFAAIRLLGCVTEEEHQELLDLMHAVKKVRSTD